MMPNTGSSVTNILIYMAGGPHWIGGVQYTRNLIRSISLLPELEQPNIYLRIGGKNLNTGLEEEFNSFKFITVDRPVDQGFLKSRVRRLVNRLSGSGIGVTKVNNVWKSDICTVAFPVKGSNFPGNFEKVLWIPDFQYKRFPDHFSKNDRRKRDAMYHDMLSTKAILVLSSESVKKDFDMYFNNYKRIIPRVMRFYSIFFDAEFSEDADTVCRSYNLPDRFAYLPNQFFVHKRHDLAFQAIAELKTKGLDIPLVCTGSDYDYRTSDNIKKLLSIISTNNIDNLIIRLGVIPRNDQIQIYRKADFVLQPSLSEGWSTTVEDARSLGKRIILSDIDVHKEQSPKHCLFFKSGDVKSLVEQIEFAWQDKLPETCREREREARNEMNKNGLDFARNFLAIMHEAHQLHCQKATQQ